jgi:hypothetical protein
VIFDYVFSDYNKIKRNIFYVFLSEYSNVVIFPLFSLMKSIEEEQTAQWVKEKVQ